MKNLGKVIPDLEKARRIHGLSPNTPCSFVENDGAGNVDLPPATAGPVGIGDDAAELIETVSLNEVLKLWPWVNRVRVTQLA